MSRLEQAILTLQDMQTASRGDARHGAGSVSGIIVTAAFLIAMLSVPVNHIGMLMWFAIYPILAAPLAGITYGSVFVKSLYTLPFIALVGAFNPLFDTAPALTVGGLTVSRGWISFASIIMRGLMSVQALVILVSANGFEGVCRGLRRLGLPSFLVTQLLMVYRYMSVLLMELLNMKRARESRSYGNRRMSLRMWGQMIGQLFLRTVNRAERINRAMLARGFDGSMPLYRLGADTWRKTDTLYVAAWLLVFLVLRLIDVAAILGFNRLF